MSCHQYLETDQVSSLSEYNRKRHVIRANIHQDKPMSPPSKDASALLWPHGTPLIVGDNMLGGIEESRMEAQEKSSIFPWRQHCRQASVSHPPLVEKPSRLIAHVGTNDASFCLKLQKFIQSELPECLVIYSSPIYRLDHTKKVVTICTVNVILKNITEINLLENNNITAKHLGKRKLHLNFFKKTYIYLAIHWIKCLLCWCKGN